MVNAKFYDTSSLLAMQDKCFQDDEKFFISYITLAELENIKTANSKDQEIKYKARQVVRLLNANEGKYEVVNEGREHCSKIHLESSNDAIILGGAWITSKSKPLTFYTDDILMKLFAKNIGLDVHYVENDCNDEQEYLGYKEVTLDDANMAHFYENLNQNQFLCRLNEYLLIRNGDGEVVDKRKWNGAKYVPLSFKAVNNAFIGKIKPINLEQELAFDMLQDKSSTIKVITGKMGAGKDIIMIANALNNIKDIATTGGRFDRLVWIRNNVEVKNTKPIGFLPGSYIEKLISFAMPLADHVGGKDGLERLIENNKVELQHLGFLRGRSLKNTILYCSEAENLTSEHIKLLIARVGEGSELWINGDYKQVDDKVFEIDNGLKCLISKLKGNELFGYMKFNKVERSETAKLADLLD